MAIRPNFSNFAPDPRNFTVPNSAIAVSGIGKMLGNFAANIQDNRAQIAQMTAFADIVGQADPIAAQMLRASAAATPKFSFGGGAGGSRGYGSGGYGSSRSRGGAMSSGALLQNMLEIADDARDQRNRIATIDHTATAEKGVISHRANEEKGIKKYGHILDTALEGQKFSNALNENIQRTEKEAELERIKWRLEHSFPGGEEAVRNAMKKMEGFGGTNTLTGGGAVAPINQAGNIMDAFGGDPKMAELFLRAVEASSGALNASTTARKLDMQESGDLMMWPGIKDEPISLQELRHEYLKADSHEKRDHFRSNVATRLEELGIASKQPSQNPEYQETLRKQLLAYENHDKTDNYPYKTEAEREAYDKQRQKHLDDYEYYMEIDKWIRSHVPKASNSIMPLTPHPTNFQQTGLKDWRKRMIERGKEANKTQ